MTAPVALARRTRAALALPAVLALVALVYLSTLAVNHSEAEDSLWYASAITRGSPAYLFHPNHLLYNAVNRVFYRGWQALGYGGDAELPSKALNVVAAVAVLALVDGLGRRVRMAVTLRIAVVAAIASCFGFWWYSVETEAYVLPLVFAFLAIRQLMVIAGDLDRWAPHALLGVFTALAILLHQQHFILGVVVLAGYALIFRAQPRGSLTPTAFAGRVALFAAVSAGLILAAYFAVIVLALGRDTPEQAVAWLRSGGNLGGYGSGILPGLLKSVFGLGRAFVGGHFLFSFPAVTAALQRALPNFDLREELFLAQGFSRTGGAVLIALTVLLLALAAAFAVLIARGHRSGHAEPRVDPARRLLGGILAAYVLLYGLFNALFLPESVEVWVAVMPALLLGLGLLAMRAWQSRAVRALTFAAVIALFLVNLTGSVLPQLNPQLDYWRQHNLWLMANAGPHDLVVLDSGYISAGYVTFYSGADVFNASLADPFLRERFDRYLQSRTPARILFAQSKGTGPGLVARPDMDTAAARQFYAGLAPQLELLHSDQWQDVYLYRPR